MKEVNYREGLDHVRAQSRPSINRACRFTELCLLFCIPKHSPEPRILDELFVLRNSNYSMAVSEMSAASFMSPDALRLSYIHFLRGSRNGQAKKWIRHPYLSAHAD